MAELPAVVPGEAINSSTFGNPVIARVISRYADASDRDFQVPVPVAGDPAYLTAGGFLQVYTGTHWETYATIPELNDGLALKVAKAGDTMTGPLVMVAANVEFDSGSGVLWPDGDGGITKITTQYVKYVDAETTLQAGHRFFIGGSATGDGYMTLDVNRLILGENTDSNVAAILVKTNDGPLYGFTAQGGGFGRQSSNNRVAIWGSTGGNPSIEVDSVGQVYLPELNAFNQTHHLMYNESTGLVTYVTNTALLQTVQDQIDDLKATVATLQAQVDAL